MSKSCTSCNRKAGKFTRLLCPECNTEIIRCDHCKALDITYKCSNCHFKAP